LQTRQMKLPAVTVKKNIPASLNGLEAIILPIKDQPIAKDQLKLTLGIRNKRIKKLKMALLAAQRNMQLFTQEQEVLTEELMDSNHALVNANQELFFQNEEKEKRAAELVIANKELIFQNEEKEKRAAELIIANKELAFQNEEKEKRANELVIANKELVFQNKEKEKRAAELVIANKELAFQNEEKENRALELIIANKELLFQNLEKEKRAAELVIANKELAFQNKEKEKRAAELVIANEELAFQNEEKEKRAVELVLANNELKAFTYIASHDLQEPLRKIQTFALRILAEDQSLTDTSRDYFHRMQLAGARMRTLIEDLLSYSGVNATERKFKKINLGPLLEDVKADYKETIEEKHATIEAKETCEIRVIVFQFRQLLDNLVSNAIKFASHERPLHVVLTSSEIKGDVLINENLSPGKTYCHICFTDNGIGFEPQYRDRIFQVFQKLHGQKEYAGTGIGLAIVKKIVDNHNGIITATGELGEGARFDMYIPVDVD
jgi:signal transduction histidine kinase